MDLLGYAPEEYIGHHISEFHADSAVIDDILKRLTCGETLIEREARLLCKNGSIKHVLIDSSVLWENGRFLHTQCFTRDISERKRAEQRLAIQYATISQLVESRALKGAASAILEIICQNSSWDVGALWLIDPKQDELHCVNIWKRPGVTVVEFESATTETAFPRGIGLPGEVWLKGEPIWISDVSSHGNFPRATSAAKEALLSGAAIPMPNNQEIFGVMEFFSFEVRERDDEFLKMLNSVGTQIAEFLQRLRAEEAATRLAAIVEQSDDAIISKGLDGIITSWNYGAEQLFGYTASEAIGQPVTMLIPEERGDEEPAILERIGRGDRLEHYETVRRRKNGELFNVSLTVSPVRDLEGRVIGASKIARDITERVRAKEKLEQVVAERTSQLRETVSELEAYSYSIAHDMRSPLRSMNSFSRILEEEFGEILPPEGKEYLRRISASATRLDALITDVLNYSKISRSELKLQRVDIEKLIREIIDSYPDLHATGASFHVEGPIPFVLGNSAALTQCVSNLFSNAVKFVPSGRSPKIRVFAERDGKKVRLWFEDNGIGISEAGRHRIFTMFQRLNASDEFEGTGIGLTIVRKNVERMGGTVGVESEPNIGSRFWFELEEGVQ